MLCDWGCCWAGLICCIGRSGTRWSLVGFYGSSVAPSLLDRGASVSLRWTFVELVIQKRLLAGTASRLEMLHDRGCCLGA